MPAMQPMMPVLPPPMMLPTYPSQTYIPVQPPSVQPMPQHAPQSVPQPVPQQLLGPGPPPSSVPGPGPMPGSGSMSGSGSVPGSMSAGTPQQQIAYPVESSQVYSTGTMVQKTPPKPQERPHANLYHYKSSTFRSWNKAPKGNPSAASNSSPGKSTAATKSSTIPEEKPNLSRRVFLYDLPASISEQSVRQHFSPAGTIEAAIVKIDTTRNGKYKYTALITFQTHLQALKAVRNFKNTMWDGCNIKMKLDTGPIPSKECAANPPKPPAPKKQRRRPVVVDGSAPTLNKATMSFHYNSDSDSD